MDTVCVCVVCVVLRPPVAHALLTFVARLFSHSQADRQQQLIERAVLPAEIKHMLHVGLHVLLLLLQPA